MIICLMVGRVHDGGLAEGLLHAWVCPESLRRYYERSLIDAGRHPGVTREEHKEIRRLKHKNAELRRASEILKLASAFFTKGLDQPRVR